MVAAIRALRTRVGAADRRADDDRGRRPQPRRHAARDVRPGARARRRRRHRRQLLGRARRRCSRPSRRWRASTSARLVAQPNAGRPRDVDGRNLYLCSPEYMASYARRFIAAGARLVGGCCGTTPEHIRQIAVAVRTVTPRRAQPASGRRSRSACAPAPAVSRREKSALARAFADREFADRRRGLVAARRGPRADAGRRRSRFHDLGAVAVNVPDYPRSGARASAVALAVLVAAAGPRRDAAALLLPRSAVSSACSRTWSAPTRWGSGTCCSRPGIPRARASYADATSVFDVDAIGLTNLVVRLNHGLDIGGQSIGAPTRFHIGVGGQSVRRRSRRRVAAARPQGRGRRGVPRHAAGLRPRRVRGASPGACSRRACRSLAGLAALEGVRHAEFFASEVVGARVPEALLSRLRAAADEARRGTGYHGRDCGTIARARPTASRSRRSTGRRGRPNWCWRECDRCLRARQARQRRRAGAQAWLTRRTERDFASTCSLFTRFLRNPRTVGAVAPSSQTLARAVVRHLPSDKPRAAGRAGTGHGRPHRRDRRSHRPEQPVPRDRARADLRQEDPPATGRTSSSSAPRPSSSRNWSPIAACSPSITSSRVCRSRACRPR